jgi:hypothetical protein
MLIKELKNDIVLQPYICEECEENGVLASISTEIDKENIVIISVDKYYNSFNEKTRPASPDCLIVQFCHTNTYHVYVVELKNIEKINLLDKDNIREKYATCLQDFMTNLLRKYFYNTDYQFTIQLILIAGYIDDKKIKNFKFDFLLGLAPITFGSKKYLIKGVNPNPLIPKC